MIEVSQADKANQEKRETDAKIAAASEKKEELLEAAKRKLEELEVLS